MSPGFIVVGAQRCGTTTLFRLLSEHPDIVRPTASKGIGYFDLHHGRGPEWYRGHFPLAVPARRRAGERATTFESSGYYCFHPLAPKRIAEELPGVRLVMMVRNPVERAWSAYKHEAARGFEDLRFAEALAAEPRRLEGEVERILAEPGYESFHHRHHAYVGRGEYAAQVERLRDTVGEGQLYIMDADDFFTEPQREFTELTSWLGLSSWTPTRVERWNARPSSDLDAALQARLMKHFERHDLRLEALTGRTPSWRR